MKCDKCNHEATEEYSSGETPFVSVIVLEQDWRYGDKKRQEYWCLDCVRGTS